jgi:hypothetical protein
MKLAEALTERKAMQERLARLRARVVANARVQEGDQPAERPEALLTEIGEVANALERLIVRINLTNVAAAVSEAPRLTLMEAVARRDMFKVRFAALAELVAAAQPNPRQFAVTRSEIRSVATVDVAEMQRRLDALAREIRELDTQLQAANWTVELVE